MQSFCDSFVTTYMRQKNLTCEKAPGRIVVSPVFARDRDVRWGRGGRLEAEREGREVEER